MKGDVKVINITTELDNRNVEVKKGILGNINVKKAEDLKIAAIYGSIIRKEKIPYSGNNGVHENSYQDIQLIFGHPKIGRYRFFYPIPKNYCCETLTKEESNGFGMEFEFAVKIVTEEGPFICERIPMSLYRVHPKKRVKKD